MAPWVMWINRPKCVWWIYTQRKRCLPDSGTQWHSAHTGLCGQSLARSLSAVQILSWTTSQLKKLKNLDFGGVHADQMISLRLVLIAPMNCVWYTELVECCPDLLSFQWISSWMCGLRFTHWIAIQSCINSTKCCAEKNGYRRFKLFIHDFPTNASCNVLFFF